MIRTFDWRDFRTLHRNRNRGLYLDTALALTGSNMRIPVGALLSSVAPATGIYTYVATDEENNSERIIGQFAHPPGSPHAQLSFISPEKAIQSKRTAVLLDHLARRAGRRGAHNLLAEVNDHSVAYDVLRNGGYAIYARQTIWQIERPLPLDGFTSPWRAAAEQDESAIRSLYDSLVPGLVQQTEPPPWEKLNGLICYQGEELLAYVHFIYGSSGILIHPFIHPDIDAVSQHLSAMVDHIPNRRDRPLFMSVRSHQAWLELYLTEMGAREGPRQAVMVKRLIMPQKVELPLKMPAAALESAHPEVTSTLAPAGNGHPFIRYDQAKNYR